MSTIKEHVVAELVIIQFPYHKFLFFHYFYHFQYNIYITASVKRVEQNSRICFLIENSVIVFNAFYD